MKNVHVLHMKQFLKSHQGVQQLVKVEVKKHEAWLVSRGCYAANQNQTRPNWIELNWIEHN